MNRHTLREGLLYVAVHSPGGPQRGLWGALFN
jgi:hypothetical protein